MILRITEHEISSNPHFFLLSFTMPWERVEIAKYLPNFFLLGVAGRSKSTGYKASRAQKVGWVNGAIEAPVLLEHTFFRPCTRAILRSA